MTGPFRADPRMLYQDAFMGLEMIGIPNGIFQQVSGLGFDSHHNA